MSIAPLVAAPLLVQLHAGAALVALLLGGFQMLAPKGTISHRKTGWIWVALMSFVAGSSIGIVSSHPLIGPFGAIHALTAFTLVTLPVAVIHARRGRIESIAGRWRPFSWAAS
jgi:uncharacterized membrane protein